jgi:transglutaminase-like putative cysteine protease
MGFMAEIENYLRCTEIIDCDTESVREKAIETTKGLKTDKEKAVALYYFVRDKIKHNAYTPLYDPSRYKASSTLEAGHGMCQNKAILLVALARAVGIPARLGFVDVEDHQLSESFKQMLGGANIMAFHGFAELCIDGRWVHASPAYDLATCKRKGFIPVEFDGVNDAKDSEYTKAGQPHMKHIKYHGPYEDLPLDEIYSYYREWIAKMGKAWDDFKGASEEIRKRKSHKK